MTTAEFLAYLRSLDVKVWVENGELCCDAPKSLLTPALRNELSNRKAEIFALHDAKRELLSAKPILRRASRDADLSLSFAQQRLWFFDQLEPGNPAYNISAAFCLAGPLNVAALEQSLNGIVRRHEVLRTTFRVEKGQPKQVIIPDLTLTLPVIDLRERPEPEREAEARHLVIKEARWSFDLARGPLLRATLVRVNEEKHVLLVSIHHSVADGWSMRIFFQELTALYGACCGGEPSRLPELQFQYADFAVWQREWLQGRVLQEQLSYWRKQLEGVSTLEFPTDWSRPKAQTFRGAKQSVILAESLSEGLGRLSRQEGATLYMTVLAAFTVLLHRHTGQDDIVLGCPIAGRNRAEIEGLIGFFVNTLVMRTDVSGNPTFRELLGRVRSMALDAYAHQDLPFDKLVEELQPERDLSRTPLFQVFLNMLDGEDQRLSLHGVTVERLTLFEPESKFDLTLYVRRKNRELSFQLVYNTDLFRCDRMTWMLEQFRTLLQGIVDHPDQRLSDLSLLTEAERRQLSTRHNLVRSTKPFIEFKKEGVEQSIAERFEEQVKKYPDYMAVRTKNIHWTYSELNAKANQIAQTIVRECGPKEQRIALLFEHDAPMIAGILGVLKAGKTYVPLDPAYPVERLSYFLEHSQAAGITTNNRNVALAKTLTNTRLQIINADEIDGVSAANLNLRISPDALAYILYTSGSTGVPKGVMQSQRNVLHHIRNYTNNLHLNSDDRLTLLSSYGFDAAVMDIFGAVLNGACLYPLNIKDESPSAMFDWIAEEKITIYHSTPSLYRYLMSALTGVEDLSKIRFVVLGGEEVRKEDVDLFKKIFSPHSIFVNGLGPTEATVALQYFIDHETEITGDIVPVGYPVENTEVLLLNKAGQRAEVYGEIGIKSEHAALGYWKKREMTEAAFLPDPEGGNKRIYRTGDIGRLLPDGSISFVARKDDQVKIRGYRIEPGEIESALLAHPAVRESVVVAREDPRRDKCLVAYIVPGSLPGPPVGALQGFLKKKLPDYMVPSVLMMLERLPLSPNGKVDRRALPEPNQIKPDLKKSFVAARTPVEKLVAQIWGEVLKLEQIGVYRSFFELGGHSLLAIQVMSRIREAYQIDLPLRALFENPTVAGVAAQIEQIQAGKAVSEEMTEILANLESISDDEAQRLLDGTPLNEEKI